MHDDAALRYRGTVFFPHGSIKTHCYTKRVGISPDGFLNKTPTEWKMVSLQYSICPLCVSVNRREAGLYKSNLANIDSEQRFGQSVTTPKAVFQQVQIPSKTTCSLLIHSRFVYTLAGFVAIADTALNTGGDQSGERCGDGRQTDYAQDMADCSSRCNKTSNKTSYNSDNCNNSSSRLQLCWLVSEEAASSGVPQNTYAL